MTFLATVNLQRYDGVMMNFRTMISIAGAILLAGCGSDKQPETDTSAQASSSAMDKQMSSDGMADKQHQMMVPDSVIEQQRQMLAQNQHFPLNTQFPPCERVIQPALFQGRTKPDLLASQLRKQVQNTG